MTILNEWTSMRVKDLPTIYVYETKRFRFIITENEQTKVIGATMHDRKSSSGTVVGDFKTVGMAKITCEQVANQFNTKDDT